MATRRPLEVRKAEYSILRLALPARPEAAFGVLLLDPAADALYFRLREDVENFADEEDAEVLGLVGVQLEAEARESGGRRLLERFEDGLSNVLRIGERQPAAVRDFPLAAERLYDERVLGQRRVAAKVLPFATHVPLYSLRAAAGRFGQDMETEPEGWVGLPAGLRPAPDMYAVHVTGRSMEPQIPDGSLAVFRHQPAGSRQGKRVLVWRRGASESGGEFTVKVYESEKRVAEDGWEHTRIRLKPLNPDYEAIELEEGSDYRVLGELVGVLALEDLP